MKQTMWGRVRRASVILGGAELVVYAGGGAVVGSMSPIAASLLEGCGLAALLLLVSAVLMRRAEPVKAGRFLGRLVFSRLMGLIVAVTVALFLQRLAGAGWALLIIGFCAGLVFQTLLQSFWLSMLLSRRRLSSGNLTP